MARGNSAVMAGFKRLHLGLAAVLLIEAVLLVVLANSNSVPVVTNYLTKDALASAVAGHDVWAPATRHLFDVKLVYPVTAFLLVGAAFAGLKATRLRAKYETELKQGISKLRRLEYVIAGGLVMLTLAAINGVYDASTLLAIFALTEILALFLVIAEARKEVLAHHPRVAGKLAFVASITPWLIIAVYLFGAQIYGSTSLSTYVKFADATLLLLCAATAAVCVSQLRGKGRWANNFLAERTYIVLGFLTYSALAWQIFFGVLN